MLTISEFLLKHPLKREVAAFLFVGCAAALTHLSVVTLLVEALRIPALAANVFGFGVAFFVSFTGHSRFTFPIEASGRAAARRRFFVVACSGFLLNQSAYAIGLQMFGERLYLPILFCVLVLVAVATFLASKRWAFASAR
jgi:putative flippase GtrA